MRLHGLQGEIDRINREIAALGAVNLAALDELTARARAQDLPRRAERRPQRQAMNTLEDAIRKIDSRRATCWAAPSTRSTSTLAACSQPLRRRPGQAGDDGRRILDAGVQVMAQPPGKKNSTIHLLSGGEKALTAIALVFAIFQLNPAPFCLLDEVDAPLDDANTERYAKLVPQMSAGTQFLFISHNKIAMEMAEATDRRDHAGAGRLAHRGGGWPGPRMEPRSSTL